MASNHERPRIKSQVGMVVSDKMEKTVVVSVEHMARHRVYHKTIRRTKRYFAHDDRLDARVGDLVRIVETRPLSRHKRWRVAEIVQKGEGAEIAPREIDSQYIGKHRERKPVEEAPAEVPGTTASEAASTQAAPGEVSAAAEEPPATETATAGEPPSAEGSPIESSGEGEGNQDEAAEEPGES